MNPLMCQRCLTQYDHRNKIPLLLSCGHSMCMPCLISQVPMGRVICKCQHQQYIDMSIVSTMIKNLDLLDLIQPIPQRPSTPVMPPSYTPISPSNANPLYFTPGPPSRTMFDNSPVRNSFTPTVMPIGSPGSGDIKCKREGCFNSRYSSERGLYDFCSFDCFNKNNMSFNRRI